MQEHVRENFVKRQSFQRWLFFLEIIKILPEVAFFLEIIKNPLRGEFLEIVIFTSTQDLKKVPTEFPFPWNNFQHVSFAPIMNLAKRKINI